MLHHLRRRFAQVHRRIGEAEHSAEAAMKNVAPKTDDPVGFQRGADDLSARGNQHFETADQLDDES